MDIKKLPDSELEVMQVIWEFEAPVPRAVIEGRMNEIHPMAQTTLLTLISRLDKKGFIKSEKKGRSSVYTPLIKQVDYTANESRNFFQRICGGSVRAFASALRDGALSEEEITELKKLLDNGEI